ncbi:ABC transporter permease [Qingrenia yutianensis]|nr:ABC transporter permease subunit [Qingrenia yutianensis]
MAMQLQKDARKHKKARSEFNRSIRQNWDLYLMLAIPVILLLVFNYYPMLGMQIAFKKYTPGKGIWGSRWVGWYQFAKMFRTQKFAQTFFNTLKISIYQILVSPPITVVFALMLNVVRNKYFKKTVQMVTYMPHFISTVIMVGILTQILNPRVGMLGNICSVLGVEAPNLWASPRAFKHIYVWSAVWQELGWNSVIYLAALSSVDTAFYEAASIDGASRFKQLFYIDLPCILPTFVILLIMRVGSMMSVGYEKVLLMQNDLNLSASEIISTYSYKVGLQTGTDYSYGTAIGLFNSVINLVLICTVNAISKKLTETSLW